MNKNMEEILKEVTEKAKIQNSLKIAARMCKSGLMTTGYISVVTNLDLSDIEKLIKILDSENDIKILADNIYASSSKKCNVHSENELEIKNNLLDSINSKDLIEYIEYFGWEPFAIRRDEDTTLLYRKTNESKTRIDSIVTIPIDTSLWNYKHLLKLAITQIAGAENCTTTKLIQKVGQHAKNF